MLTLNYQARKSCQENNDIFKSDTIFGESRKNGLKIFENIIEITNKLLLGLLQGFLFEIFLPEVFIKRFSS
jgi:hypothetical protein